MSALHATALYVSVVSFMLCEFLISRNKTRSLVSPPEGQAGTHRESKRPLSRGSAGWEGGWQFLLPSISSGHRILVILFWGSSSFHFSLCPHMREADSALFPKQAHKNQPWDVFCNYWERGSIFLQELLEYEPRVCGRCCPERVCQRMGVTQKKELREKKERDSQ